MALKTFVKIGNVNNLSDARYCAGMNVHLMGFNMEENNSNYVSPDKFREITNWLSGPEYVGEFEASHPDILLKALENYEIHYVQIKEVAHLQMLVNTSYKFILKQTIQQARDIQHLISIAPSLKENDVSLLLESEELVLNKEILQPIKELAGLTGVLLGFGLTADNVENILEQTKVKGIALNAGAEIKPGLGDFEKLADLLEVLDADD